MTSATCNWNFDLKTIIEGNRGDYRKLSYLLRATLLIIIMISAHIPRASLSCLFCCCDIWLIWAHLSFILSSSRLSSTPNSSSLPLTRISPVVFISSTTDCSVSISAKAPCNIKNIYIYTVRTKRTHVIFLTANYRLLKSVVD